MTDPRDESLLQQFKDALEDYATNSVTALEGAMQLTTNELADLARRFHQLDHGDREAALAAAHARGVDTSRWR